MRTTSSAVYLTPPAPGQPDAWTSETSGHGKQLIAVLTQAPCSIEREVLDVLMTPRLVTRQRVLAVDGRPVEIATSFYPAHIAEGTALARPAPIKGGAVRLLADLGWHTARAVEDVGAEPADKEQAEALGIPEGNPLLVMRRTSFNREGTPFEYLHAVACDGRRQRYVLELD